MYYQNPTEPEDRELARQLLSESSKGSFYRKLDNMRKFVEEQPLDQPTQNNLFGIIEMLALEYHANKLSLEQASFIEGAHLSELCDLWTMDPAELSRQVGQLEKLTRTEGFPIL